MNAKETVMDAARMGFVQILMDHTTATVTVAIAVMVEIVQVRLHSETRLSNVYAFSVVFLFHCYFINVIISHLPIEIERTKCQNMVINSLNNLYCD